MNFDTSLEICGYFALLNNKNRKTFKNSAFLSATVIFINYPLIVIKIKVIK